MQTHKLLACLLALGALAPAAVAAQYTVTDMPATATASDIKPHEIAFTELDHDPDTNPVGLIPFEEWERTKPEQKRFLSPFPDYVEPTVVKPVDGVEKTITERLLMYVAEARFAVARPPGSIDLASYATADFLGRLDPAIEHKPIPPSEADNESNKNPARPWCVPPSGKVACVRSTYRLEGKLPIAVQLVNQLTDQSKLDDFLEFQSELGILSPPDLDQAGLARLTGIDTPVAGAIEQTIFHINQIMQFGKFLAVLQADPADPNRTLVTAYIALALKARPLESSKKYENVPVLRNMVPGMVLAGKSSFNTGQSISAGLPLFARNNIKAVAAILDAGSTGCATPYSLLKVRAKPKAPPRYLSLALAGQSGAGSVNAGTAVFETKPCGTSLLEACACPRQSAQHTEGASQVSLFATP